MPKKKSIKHFFNYKQINTTFCSGRFGRLRGCLVCNFKQPFSVFKQHFTHFNALFHSHVFPQIFSNNNFQFLNTYTKQTLKVPKLSKIHILPLDILGCWTVFLFFLFFLENECWTVYEQRVLGSVWFVFSNNNFQCLKNITCISIHFFTHTYFHKYFQTIIFSF